MNGAFRPKGGNGVHGLCDDAGMSRSDKGVKRRVLECAGTPPALCATSPCMGGFCSPNGAPAEAQRSTRKGYAASVAQQSC